MIDIFLIMTSIHLDNHEDYNEFNPGIAIRHEQVVTGVYHNSFYDTSAFVGWDMNWKHDEIEYGFLSGGVTGYEYDWTVGGVTAFVAPYISYDFNGVKPTVLLLGNAATFSLGYSF